METTNLVSFLLDYSWAWGYLFFSFFVMAWYLHKEDADMREWVKGTVKEFNDELLKEYKEKKISAMVYQRRKLDFDKDLREVKRLNMILAPFMAPKITFNLIYNYANCVY